MIHLKLFEQFEDDEFGEEANFPKVSDRENLVDLEVGDKVYHYGYGGFCRNSEREIVGITRKYDEDTGSPYKVIIIDGGQKFDSRDGHPLTSPWAYSIKVIK